MAIFICPNCGNRTESSERTAGFQSRAKGCKKCGFGCATNPDGGARPCDTPMSGAPESEPPTPAAGDQTANDNATADEAGEKKLRLVDLPEDILLLFCDYLEEENLLDRAEVLDDAAVLEEHRRTDDPCSSSQQPSQYETDDPDLGQLPLDGARLDVGIIVSNGHGSQVGEQCNEDDERPEIHPLTPTEFAASDAAGCGTPSAKVQASSRHRVR